MRPSFRLALSSLCVVSSMFGCSDSDSPGEQPDTLQPDTAIADTTPEVELPDTEPPGVPCEASMSTACKAIDCPADIDSVPTASWCSAATASGVQRSTTACSNYQIVAYIDSASGDSINTYYNSSTGALAGRTSRKAGTETCVGGVKGFRIPPYDDCAWDFGPNICGLLDAGPSSDSSSSDSTPSDSTPSDAAADGG